MSPPAIYLDNNSTTALDPRVAEAMTRAWRDCGANPASQHAAGRRARRRLEEAREGILSLLGARTAGMDADVLVFTSGGTEANNLALFGLVSSASSDRSETPAACRRLLVSALEHPSVAGAAAELARRGCRVTTFRADSEGVARLDLPDQQTLSGEQERFGLVSLMLANNETGVIQPVAALARYRDGGAIIHSDAVQAVGKIPVDFRALEVDALTVAPHKFHGPLGIGALVLRHGVKLQPQLFGGFQQAGMRPGTESVALAFGFHEALKLALADLPEGAARMRTLRDALERELRSALPELVVLGEHADRLPNTSCLALPGIDRQQLVMALDLAGIACSTGSACASGSSEPSPTLLAMGLPRGVVESAFRLSLSALTTGDEVEEAARRILITVNHLRSAK